MKQSQDNDMLEFSEVIPASHYLYNIEQILYDTLTIHVWATLSSLIQPARRPLRHLLA